MTARRWSRRPGSGRPQGRRRLGVARSFLAIVAGGLALAGCSSVRNDLGTGNSSCYVALPSAAAAVSHRGHLHGVRLVSAASLRARVPALYDAAVAEGQHSVCLVAFTGEFKRAEVQSPAGQAQGDLAVVELGYPDHRLLRTLVITRQPLPFGHSHISFLFPL